MVRVFDNRDGSGVVGLERYEAPEEGAGHWFGALRVGGEQVFGLIHPCGTCGFAFEKLDDPARQLDDEAAVALLGGLESVPDDAMLAAIGAVLTAGRYRVLVVEGTPTLVVPGTRDDYFTHESPLLFGVEAPPFPPLTLPKTRYYHFGELGLVSADRGGDARFQFVVPMHEYSSLDRARIAHWVASPAPLTAVAVSALDVQAPAVDELGADPDYPYTSHVALCHYLVDGHHRMAAAAEAGRPIRILSFVAETMLGSGGAELLERYAAPA